MAALKPITIVGGGLAGLTLGISLRRYGIPVTVLEMGHYPRHRICGEFISGRGLQVLGRLDLPGRLVEAGAISASTVAFCYGRTSSPRRALKTRALCLSRFDLDACLANRFRELGGELREGQRFNQDAPREGFVHASGRRARPIENGWRWFGFKAHAQNVSLAADLEMHVLENGYVGLCRLKGDLVNVCGLFRRPAGAGQPVPPWQKLLSGPAGTGLHQRMAGAVFDEDSFCSVAGLALRPRLASESTQCCIGDALTMTPPVTGNGMSMAFESAEIASEPLAAYSRDELGWDSAQQVVARACDERFGRRLAWAKWLQWIMFAPAFRGRLGSLALKSDLLWRLMLARTR